MFDSLQYFYDHPFYFRLQNFEIKSNGKKVDFKMAEVRSYKGPDMMELVDQLETFDGSTADLSEIIRNVEEAIFIKKILLLKIKIFKLKGAKF
jgi:hypothetical protein